MEISVQMVVPEALVVFGISVRVSCVASSFSLESLCNFVAHVCVIEYMYPVQSLTSQESAGVDPSQ